MKTRLLLMSLVGSVLTAVLTGCGGGGSTCASGAASCTTTVTTPTGGSTPVATDTISVTLSSSTVTSAAPATVTAKVLTATGAPVAGAVVNFTVDPTIGLLSAKSALTNASGVATVGLSPAASTIAGADTVTATVASATSVTASTGYQLSATTAAIATFTSNTGASAAGPLTAYGQAVLTVTLTGVSTSAPVTLTLTSACVSAGKATISPATVTNTSGAATFTYKDTGGCGSILTSDTVTASVAGAATSSTDLVFLTSPVANSLTFTSASPQTIFLKGSGNVESSTVKFEVVDTAGNPLPGQKVRLSPSTLAGGLLLDQGTVPVTQTSDSNGFVSVIINSGTVPTPVRVLAALLLPDGTVGPVSTVSRSLSVVTGLPSQLHFSLSQLTINIEGANYDGVPNVYTVIASDRSGNPVPDGTAVLFWSEGGQIQGSQNTATSNGTSSAVVSFQTSQPKPADGRVTVLAYAIGEESFIDLHGTNVWQSDDPFQDLGDVVKSKLYDGIYDPANDETVSLSLSGAVAGNSTCNTSFDAAYPQFALDARVPSKPGTCDATWSGKTYVRRAVETVFSTSNPRALWPLKSQLDSSCASIKLYPGPQTLTTQQTYFPVATNPTVFLGVLSGGFSIVAADANTVRVNPMPAGTTVAIIADDSSVLTLATTGGSPIGSTSEALGVSFSFKFLLGSSGGANIVFTTPKGVTNAVHVNLVGTAPPSTCPN